MWFDTVSLARFYLLLELYIIITCMQVYSYNGYIL